MLDHVAGGAPRSREARWPEAAGFTPGDRRLLECLARAARPMGIESLAAALRMEARTLRAVHEPYLLERGYLRSGPRGREATPAGRARVRASAALGSDTKSIPVLGAALRLSDPWRSRRFP